MNTYTITTRRANSSEFRKMAFGFILNAAKVEVLTRFLESRSIVEAQIINEQTGDVKTYMRTTDVDGRVTATPRAF